MRKLLAFLIALGAVALMSVSVPSPPKAGCIIGGGIICGSSAPTYAGPGDIATYTSFGSCAFVLNAASATTSTSICDLVAVTGGAAVCTLRGLASGAVDQSAYCPGTLSPAAACADASGESCKISQVYDQTGHGHAWTQTTLATMPPLVFSGIETNPVINCSSSVTLASNSITLTVPFGVEMVAEQVSGAPSTSAFMFATNANQTILELDDDAAILAGFRWV